MERPQWKIEDARGPDKVRLQPLTMYDTVLQAAGESYQGTPDRPRAEGTEPQTYGNLSEAANGSRRV